jgi:hypothetical protein
MLQFRIDTSSQNPVMVASLGETTDSMPCITSTMSVMDYKNQWLSAIDLAISERMPSAIFSSLELDTLGQGRLWLFNIIPEENAVVHDGSGTGFFVTQQFIFVTTNPDNLKVRTPISNLKKGTKNPYDYISPYYLDLNNLDRIFPYLWPQISGISHWYFTRDEVISFADNLRMDIRTVTE